MNIQKDLKQFLNETKWTQVELAKRSGVTQSTISMLLTGSRKGCGSKVLEKLWPYLYGDRRPVSHDHNHDEAA